MVAIGRALQQEGVEVGHPGERRAHVLQISLCRCAVSWYCRGVSKDVVSRQVGRATREIQFCLRQSWISTAISQLHEMMREMSVDALP